MANSTRALAAAIALLSAACAATTQTLQIRPEVQARGSVDGKGVAVAVEVEDQRGAPPPRGPAEPVIEIEPGVEDAVRRAVVQGLLQLRFAPTDGAASRTLRVEIQEASLTTETGSGRMFVRSRAALHVVDRLPRQTVWNTIQNDLPTKKQQMTTAGTKMTAEWDRFTLGKLPC